MITGRTLLMSEPLYASMVSIEDDLQELDLEEDEDVVRDEPSYRYHVFVTIVLLVLLLVLALGRTLP